MHRFVTRSVLISFFTVALVASYSPNAHAYGGLISNGDFESGHTAWFEGREVGGNISQVNDIIEQGNNGGSGNYYAYTYASSLGRDVLFSNNFILPSGNDSLILNYDSKYSIGSGSFCTTGTNGMAVGLYDNTADETIGTIELNNANNTTSNEYAYSNHSAGFGPGLSSRAGHSISLTFFSLNSDANCDQLLFLDNVSLHNGELTPVHRFYNFKKGVHFYTANQAEASNVNNKMSSTYKYEGVAYYASPTQVADSTPVHRFYNFKQGVHFYTANQAEASNVNNTMSSTYRYEGVSYYAQP